MSEKNVLALLKTKQISSDKFCENLCVFRLVTQPSHLKLDVRQDPES